MILKWHKYLCKEHAHKNLEFLFKKMELNFTTQKHKSIEIWMSDRPYPNSPKTSWPNDLPVSFPFDYLYLAKYFYPNTYYWWRRPNF